MADSGGRGRFNGLLGQHTSFMSAYNIAQVCLTWFVFTFTRSAVDVGLVAIVETLSVLLVSLPVGSLVDRLNKGFLLSVSGIAGFAVFLFLALYTQFFKFELSLVMFLAALWGASREISKSAGLSALPDLAPEGNLAQSNGIFRALGSSLGSISNALAGGLIVTLGIIAGFLFSSGAYLISFLFSAAILLPAFGKVHSIRGAKKGKRKGMLSDVAEGYRWLIRKKGFFLLTVSATFFNFFMEMAVTYFVVYVAVGIHADPLIYGLILSGYAAGDVTGSLLAGRLNILRHSGKVNVLLYGGIPGLCLLIVGVVPGPLIAILFTTIAGLCLGISINAWLTTAHNVVPPDMRGRYFAIDGVLSSISPAAIAAGAVMISFVGILNDFIIAGIMMIIFTAVFAGMKSLWRLDGSVTEKLIETDKI